MNNDYQPYSKYGQWINGEWAPYDDMGGANE